MGFVLVPSKLWRRWISCTYKCHGLLIIQYPEFNSYRQCILSQFIKKINIINFHFFFVLHSFVVLFCLLKWNLLRHEIPERELKIKGIFRQTFIFSRQTWPRFYPHRKILNDVNEEINLYIWTAGHASNDATHSQWKPKWNKFSRDCPMQRNLFISNHSFFLFQSGN